MDALKETLRLLNPWWEIGKIGKELSPEYRREVFSKLITLIDKRPIIILSGLRRIGKTTLLYQLIESLLDKTEKNKIIYFNLDKKIDELTEILNAYQELTSINWKEEKIYFFVDEISKLEKWGGKIKLLYDAFPKIKFLISSSSSVSLEEEAIKNLGGRYFLTNVKPLSFREFLELRGKKDFLSIPNLWEKELKKELKIYQLRSFPEIINWENELLVKDYLRTTILDKIIRQDLIEKFSEVNRSLLTDLLRIFYTEPGFYLNYDNLSESLKISKKTLFQHVFCLEFSYLIRIVKNFRVSTLSTSRKLQRVYTHWWSLAYCYSDNEDKIIENLVASTLDAKYYWRKLDKEVDFIVLNGKDVLPIEVKNKSELKTEDISNMKYFLEKYKIPQGVIIYHGEEKEIKFDNKKIKLIPLWKWLLQI